LKDYLQLYLQVFGSHQPGIHISATGNIAGLIKLLMLNEVQEVHVQQFFVKAQV